MPQKVSVYVKQLTLEQINKLHDILVPRGWEMKAIPYAHWQARLDKTSVTAYESGKLTVQGKGMEDFIIFTLEPEILQEASFGYELGMDTPETDPLEGFEPHAGIDESGKGDYFGPLVIAGVYADYNSARQLVELGVKDSKAIKSDKKIATMAPQIMRIVQGKFAIVTIGPEAYNRMYSQFANLNKMLAWGHARTIENLLEKAPECNKALSDKFANERLIENALLENGRKLELTQRTKAESDVAVAAASILARNAFVAKMDAFSRELDMEIPKGASAAVIQTARTIVGQFGDETLKRYAKMHFKTTEKVFELF
ncbi:MAG: ribonuclease HIII [Victivallales bacterium]|nr:ribonuclease HIII [Victivallales bacterium]